MERAGPQPETTANPCGRQVLILGNPHAGTGASIRHVEELVGALRTHGFEPRVCWEREELSAAVEATPREELRCIVAAGGDGTLIEVLNRAPGLPVTVLPLGNENLVARYCRLGRSGRRLAEVIATGQLVEADLGRVNGRLFCLMASAGIDADVVHRVHARRSGHINKLSYVLPLLRAFWSYRYPPIEAVIEETGETLRGAMVHVFNLPQYALGLPVAEGVKPHDGCLDLLVFERPGFWSLLRYVHAIRGKRHRKLPDVQHRLVRRVRLTGDRVPLQTDGDPAGSLPAHIEVVPDGLTLLTARAAR
jgi:diacylglycerol kinase family enzyme